MSKVKTFLMFKDRAEEAVELYTSVVPNSRITNRWHLGDGPTGPMVGLDFELDGRPYSAMDGGPSFSFAEGMSLWVDCETQEEIDDYSAKLIAGGGEQGPCGWLKDRFGVSWQIVPTVLGELITDKDATKAKRALEAMLGMKKLDIAALKRAHAGEGEPIRR